MEIKELNESSMKSEMIREKFYEAISIGDYRNAIELNEEVYRLTIDRYLKGNSQLKFIALSELKELSAQFDDVNDALELMRGNRR